MSTLFWITILIISIAVFIFVVVPWSETSMIELRPAEAQQQASAEVKKPVVVVDELAKYYTPVGECVMEDYPRRAIGECPQSKAMSSALPITNVPLCVAIQSGPLSVSV